MSFNSSHLQYILPRHLLSRVAGKLANAQTPWLKNALINAFIKYYDVDMQLAKRSLASEFAHFNDFFTRELRDDIRPLSDETNVILSSCDGTVCQFGHMQNNTLLQAKSRAFSLSDLLAADTDMLRTFHEGSYLISYLSPRDYHRVHMPVGGTLLRTIYVPGDLFSVNVTTCATIPNIFARNERLICEFATDKGPMLLILVGAIIVAGIETVWSGQVCPTNQQPRITDYTKPQSITLARGEEMGRFKLGSTSIVIFPKANIDFHAALTVGKPLHMGESVAYYRD